MKKLIAATVLSALLFVPNVAGAQAGKPTVEAPAGGEVGREVGHSTGKEIFAFGCDNGRPFIIFSNGNGTYSGGPVPGRLCKDGNDWIEFA